MGKNWAYAIRQRQFPMIRHNTTVLKFADYSLPQTNPIMSHHLQPLGKEQTIPFLYTKKILAKDAGIQPLNQRNQCYLKQTTNDALRCHHLLQSEPYLHHWLFLPLRISQDIQRASVSLRLSIFDGRPLWFRLIRLLPIDSIIES